MSTARGVSEPMIDQLTFPRWNTCRIIFRFDAMRIIMTMSSLITNNDLCTDPPVNLVNLDHVIWMDDRTYLDKLRHLPVSV